MAGQGHYEVLLLDAGGEVDPPGAAADVERMKAAGGLRFNDKLGSWCTDDGTSLYVCACIV